MIMYIPGMWFFRFNTEIRFSAKYMVIEIDPDPVKSQRAFLLGGGVSETKF